MAETWLANAVRVTGNNGGSMTADGSRKLLLHSTEGSSIEGAIGAYTTNNSWPHLTVDLRRRRIVQHLPFNIAARALRNEAGGVQTNREGTYLVQIEMVGSAVNPESLGSPDDLDWFGREVVAPIHVATGVPLVSTVTWRSYPGSYGKTASQRLSPALWDLYNGVLGHQHAPENTHGDPGLLDVARILRAAKAALEPPPPPEEDDDMPVLYHLLKFGQSGGDAWFVLNGGQAWRVFDSTTLANHRAIGCKEVEVKGGDADRFIEAYRVEQAQLDELAEIADHTTPAA